MSSTHFTLLDGTRVAYQEWGADQPKKVIALHGWLDNSNSFQAVAPYLASNGYHIVAIDFIGHGHTSHLPYAGTYNMPRMVQSIREVVHRCLSWDKSYVIGHSMGAGIGLLYSGSYPESVNKLVMIDLLGPLADNSFRTAKDLRAATDLSMKFTEKLTSGSAQKQYQSLKDVIAARLESVKKFPGNQTLSFEAAKAIMSRGVRVVGSGDDDHADVDDESVGPVTVRHDIRLSVPTSQLLTNEQILSFFKDISFPTLFVHAEFGWPISFYGSTNAFNDRTQILKDKGLLTQVEIKNASHHLHIDPESAQETAKTISNFLLDAQD